MMKDFTNMTLNEKTDFVLQASIDGKTKLAGMTDNQTKEFLSEFITICANIVFTDKAEKILKNSGEEDMTLYLQKIGKKIRSPSIKKLLLILTCAVAGIVSENDSNANV
jgi:hypothetical protein